MLASPSLPAAQIGTDALLQTLLDASATGIAQLSPVYAAHEPQELVDFAYVRLNPAAQRLLGLPEYPLKSLRDLAPEATADFAFYQHTFLSEAPGHRLLRGTTAAGQACTLRVAAQRSGPHLVASFTEVPAAPAAQGTAALVQEAQVLRQVFAPMPAAIGLLHGPEHRFEYVNAAFRKLFASRELVGRPAAEALPEILPQGVVEVLNRVYQSGETFTGLEVPVTIAQPHGMPSQPHYLNLIYQAHPENGHPARLSVFASDVTEQVLSRQRVQQLNEELRTLNEQLQAANEELYANNHELAHTQQQLRLLNQELECRVATGVREAQLARDAAEQQRQRLARFFQQAPAAICVLDGPNLVYELVNPEYQKIFPDRSLLDRPMRQAVPEQAYQLMQQWLHQVYETGVTHEGHEVLIPIPVASDGPLEDHYFNCVYQARLDNQGRIDGVLVFALDITEQVLAQRRIAALQAEAQAAAERRAQERETFYQIFEHSPAIVSLMWGPTHRFAYFNHAFQRLFPGRELRNLGLAEALPETVEQGFVARLDKVYRTGESYVINEVPLTVAQPDGQAAPQLYLNIAYQPYRENGQTLGVSVFAYDVTEQVLARREHEASQAQLQTVFEQAPVALALLQGPAYVVAVANPAICELWGRDRPSVTGRPLFELLPEIANQGIREILNEVRRTGAPFVATEMPVDLVRGGRRETVYFNFVYQPLADAQGEFSSVVIVATDMTAGVLSRRQAYQAFEDLRTTNAQLTRTNTDLDTFIYTASHDLKSPIANIEGLLLLLRKQLPAEARQAGLVPRVLDMMQGAIERFQLTISQLTDLAKLQHAHIQPAEEVNLPAVVEAVRLDLAPLLTEAHAELVINLDSCATVSFAPQHLRSIIYNLLSNAIKYRHPDRPLVVQVRCHHTDAATLLDVQDNGLGLTPAQQSKLFGMFRRLHDHVPGSGVGLYMVKRIVENAGGTISVQSQPEVGSTFTVSLPS
ncbi:MAG: PAS domain-containing protein [Janthinobacterium lividum]